ncbi:MAG: Gmad2 immunoglobulin-like domain-containing protein [bacterium]|nr:Gmad2 immunoglobulin-like domain-containing protein [bacterium]
MFTRQFLIGVGGLLVLLFAASALYMYTRQYVPQKTVLVTTFEECVAAGNSVMESYPRQCRHGDQSFTESLGNTIEKTNLIRLYAPLPNGVIESPLAITGEARGNWFFEASFPIVLTDWDGRIIAQTIATAQGEWMTTDFVPFEATLTFTPIVNAYSNRGSLILQKDNPSGLPENDDALEIPVIIGRVAASSAETGCTLEARLCPDGSAVGRTGPNCEFAPCSSE